MWLRERKREVMEQLQDFAWHVRKQHNWCGGYEYSIEVEGLAGLVSYGDTYRDAKEGLIESAFFWMRHLKLERLPNGQNGSPHLIHISTTMSDEEFEQINLLVQQW